jgi:hypothetical protein
MTGRLMKRDHTRGHIMPSYLCLKPRVQFWTAPLTTFWERLDFYGNCSLWENLSYDSAELIQDGLCGGSLCIAQDGSDMAEESPDLCSVGVIIFCWSTQQWLKLSVAKLSDAAK